MSSIILGIGDPVPISAFTSVVVLVICSMKVVSYFADLNLDAMKKMTDLRIAISRKT